MTCGLSKPPSALVAQPAAVIASDHRPGESRVSSAPFGLPRNLELRLKETADKAAAEAIPKLREAVGRLVFSLQGQDKQVAVADLLTWNELIHTVYFKVLHTVYFKVPIFRKLVCYAIAHSEGFRPSEKLKADPDHEKLGEWLAEIQGQTHAAASSAASSSQ